MKSISETRRENAVKQWAKVTPEQRSEHARKMAMAKWKGVPVTERRAHSVMMNKAQAKKKADKSVV